MAGAMVFYIKAGARDDVDDDGFHFTFPELNECVNNLSHIVECIVLTANPTNSGSLLNKKGQAEDVVSPKVSL